MSDDIVFGIVLFILAVGVIVWLVSWLFGLRVRVVTEEKRLVIYRLGTFNRLAGPGPILLTRFDTVEREINVRDQPYNVRVDNLYMKGVPFGYTLNFWCRTNPEGAAMQGREQLRNLALFTDNERKQQVGVKVREALVRSTAKIETEYELPKNAVLFQKLVPIFPGLPLCEKLLDYLRVELTQTLPTIGVAMNNDQPIAIAALHLTPTILNGFKYGHIAGQLRELYPDLSSERILRTVATIDGIDLQEQRVILDGNSPARASIDFRQGEDGIESRLKVYPDTEEKMDSRKRKQSEVNPTHDDSKEVLTAEDLHVLKPVPPFQPRRAVGD